jgi:hypothetical protein
VWSFSLDSGRATPSATTGGREWHWRPEERRGAAAGLEDLKLEQKFWISGWISRVSLPDLLLIQFYSAVLKYGV